MAAAGGRAAEYCPRRMHCSRRGKGRGAAALLGRHAPGAMDSATVGKVLAVSAAVGAATAAAVLAAVGAGASEKRPATRCADPSVHVLDELDDVAAEHLRRAIEAGKDVPSLKSEQLSRNRQFFDDDGQDRIERAFVVVVGLGGVGSHAANMLVRAGVRRVRLVDFDNVSLSSLNRHATATRANVGEPKVKALADHLRLVCPWCEIEAVPSIFRGEDADDLLAGSPDLVLDCIDDSSTKAQLLLACDRLGLRCISSLGAGGKSDPTRVHIGKLAHATIDPLAAKLRYTLRCEILKARGLWEDRAQPGDGGAQAGASPGAAAAAAAAAAPAAAAAAAGDEADGGDATPSERTLSGDPAIAAEARRIMMAVDAVYSSEPAVKALMPLADAQAANPEEFGLLAGFRLRVIPVLGTVPALFGQAVAGHALCELAGKPIADPVPAPGLSQTALTKLTNRLQSREAKVHGERDSALVQQRVDHAVCGYHFTQVWRGRDALDCVPAGKKPKLGLTRWAMDRPASIDNLVLADERGIVRLEKEGNGWVDPAVAEQVEGRLAWVRASLAADKRATTEAAAAMEAALARGSALEATREAAAESEWLWAGAYLLSGFAVGCATVAVGVNVARR